MRVPIFNFQLPILNLQLIVALLLACASAWADPTVKVTFPEKGRYIYWIEFSDAGGRRQLTAPKQAAGTGTAIDLAPATADGKLAAGVLKIFDPKSGNVAAKDLQNLVDKKETKLRPADFDLVRTVRILLRPAEGDPDERVESAVVTIKDANSDEFTALVDPSSEGVAQFHDIAGGQESVTVAYDGGRMTVDLEVPLDRETPVFTHAVAISADVRTVRASGMPAERASGERQTAAPRQRPSSGGWLPVLVGILFLAMVGFVAYVALKAKGATVGAALKKLGVELPESAEPQPAGAEPAQQIDPNICQFCGQRKDPVTGACACSIDQTASPRPSAAGVGIPRLVGIEGPYAGQIFELTGDNTTIGRDTSNDVALGDDATVSRRHAALRRENGTLKLQDEGSSNGTFLNGARISAPQALQAGDEVQIGSSKFRFEE